MPRDSVGNVKGTDDSHRSKVKRRRTFPECRFPTHKNQNNENISDGTKEKDETLTDDRQVLTGALYTWHAHRHFPLSCSSSNLIETENAAYKRDVIPTAPFFLLK
jgi:hypothetical protein